MLPSGNQLDESRAGRPADPQQERLRFSSRCACQQLADERAVPVESVAQQQAARRQAAQELAGQSRFTLHEIRGRDGGGQGRVGAQFHQHRAAQFGEGSLETPGGRLGHRAEDARGVRTRELRAVDAYEPKPRVERLGLALGIGQRDERLSKHGLEDFPGHGQAALARRRVADLLAGEFMKVGCQGPLGLADVVNQSQEQFRSADPSQATRQRTVLRQDGL